jgi:hypothetical protein
MAHHRRKFISSNLANFRFQISLLLVAPQRTLGCVLKRLECLLLFIFRGISPQSSSCWVRWRQETSSWSVIPCRLVNSDWRSCETSTAITQHGLTTHMTWIFFSFYLCSYTPLWDPQMSHLCPLTCPGPCGKIMCLLNFPTVITKWTYCPSAV